MEYGHGRHYWGLEEVGARDRGCVGLPQDSEGKRGILRNACFGTPGKVLFIVVPFSIKGMLGGDIQDPGAVGSNDDISG